MNGKLTLCVVLMSAIIAAAPGCNRQKQTVSNIPLLDPNASKGPGPWQVITAQGEPVTFYEKRVYLNRKSTFILADGTPIRTIEGDVVYLNKKGQVINKHLKVVPFDYIFELNKKQPLPRTAALMLKDYGKLPKKRQKPPAQSLP